MFVQSTTDKQGRHGRLRIGVIGLGLIAQSAHLPALDRLGDRIEISHLCDVSPGLAEQIAVPGHPVRTARWQDLLGGERPDAVIICTPGSHGRLTQAFLQAGVHVLAEKPLCLTVAEATELEAAAVASNTVLQVGYMKATDLVVAAAARAVRESSDPRLVRVTVYHPADEPQIRHLNIRRGGPVDAIGQEELDQAAAYERARLDDAVGDDPALQDLYGNVLQGSIVHELSLLRAVVGGLPRWTHAQAWPLGSADEPPCVQAMGNVDERLSAFLSWNWLPTFPDYDEELAVLAADNRISLRMEPPYSGRPSHLTVLSSRPDDTAARYRAETVTVGYESSFETQLGRFLDAVEGGVPADGAAEVALDVVNLYHLLALIADQHGRTLGGEASKTVIGAQA